MRLQEREREGEPWGKIQEKVSINGRGVVLGCRGRHEGVDPLLALVFSVFGPSWQHSTFKNASEIYSQGPRNAVEYMV